MAIKGEIESIGVSGRHWIGFSENRAYDLLVDTLNSSKKSIRIATYSFGKPSPELDTIFQILKNKSSTGIEVQLIVNKFWSASSYARKKLKELEEDDTFTLLNFDPENENENLHAKIVSVDGNQILIGSANMSKSGLFSTRCCL